MRIVLVPGFTQTAASWRQVVDALPLRQEVVALDVPVEPDFAATAHAIGDAGGPGLYVGYSMGGRLVQRLALDRPDLVLRAVLVSTSPGLADPAARAERIEADEQLAQLAERDGAESFMVRWLAQPMWATLPPGAEEGRLRDAAAIAHQLRVLGTGTMEPLWDRLGEMHAPTRLVTGTQDTKFAAVAREMLGALPDATHQELPGGHGLVVEQPAALATIIQLLANG
ncbi:MAG: putative hydrolase or acyltransferase of alpha/beta superfamily [Actinomycetia bacterium]|nr:putative hydrolase or acyltransferase of alpha/beta superfamily [Actinomycetes bacterium]